MMSRRTKRVVLGFMAVGLLVAFVFVASMRFLNAQRERQRYEQERAELKPPEPVSVVIRDSALKRERKFAADILPWVQANVPSEVSGRVVETSIEAGQSVKAGDVLVKLDDHRAKIAVDLAAARHAEAMRLFGEAERLQKSRVVSKTAYETALSETKVAKAQLDEAKDSLDKQTIRAPFDGFVNMRKVDVGDAVGVNQTVAELVALSRLRVILDVAGGDLAAFRPGQGITLLLMSGQSEEPVVRYVARSSDPSTKLFRVEAELDNPDAALRGGLQGIVRADVAVFPEGPVVPASAVRFEGKDAMVLKDEGKPVPTPIVIGPEVGGVYPVFDGLKAGDRVFIR